VYKTMTDGDELFTMQPNFGAKMVKDKTRQASVSAEETAGRGTGMYLKQYEQ